MPASTTPSLRVTLDQARAFWHRKQGLAAPRDGDPADVVAATGWARTLGGVDVYLAVRARCPGLRRDELDHAVGRGALRVVPAVRGCIYLVPAGDVPLMMALAADLQRPRTERDLEKVGVELSEVEDLAAEVAKALADGPLSTPGVRKALPEGAVRSLGDVGKKVGLSSPLPVALRELEFRGEIERSPIGGRLDTERYEWRLAETPAVAIPDDKIGRLAAVTRRFFEFFGPATLKELATWVGVPQRDAKAAMAELPLVPVAIEGHGEAWVLEDDRQALAAASTAPPAFAFLPFEDNFVTVHGGPGVLVNPAFHDRPVKQWGGSGGPTTLGEARHIGNRPLLLGERLVGFWEYDPDAGEVVAATFESLSRGRELTLRTHGERLAAFVHGQLGHARSFSLDTDDAVRQRAAELRATRQTD